MSSPSPGLPGDADGVPAGPCFAARAACSLGAVAAFAGTLVWGTWLLSQVVPGFIR